MMKQFIARHAYPKVNTFRMEAAYMAGAIHFAPRGYEWDLLRVEEQNGMVFPMLKPSRATRFWRWVDRLI